jgi:raffinose/stachyose/melibiose transport system permease protein
MAVPAVAVVIALRYAGTVAGGWYAFTNWDGSSFGAQWVGLANFKAIFHDPSLRGALWHTLEIAALFVVLVNVIGLGLALCLNRALKTRSLLRALFFLPFALSELATAYIWQFIFQYNGPLNSFLSAVGLQSLRKDWLGDPHLALFAILVVLLWQFSGFTMVVYLAGLQAIPDELHDAMAVDAAPRLLGFRRVTFPLLAPAVTVATTVTLIFGLSVFAQVIALTGGGPVFATQTLATQVYQHTFQDGQYAYGAALALMLTVLVSAVALTSALIVRRRLAQLSSVFPCISS